MAANLVSGKLGGMLRSLNDKRNDILHGEPAGKKHAEAMIKAARSAVQELRLATEKLSKEDSLLIHRGAR